MNHALEVGAQHSRQSASREWRSMDSAPRDGTVIEIMCTYGVAPWYDLVKWTNEYKAWCVGGDDAGHYITMTSSEPSWRSVTKGSSPASESSLKWRPYNGDPANYVDPTGGMQDDMAYWRGAVAAKYGLPLDHFEELAERNRRANNKKWWQFWL